MAAHIRRRLRKGATTTAVAAAAVAALAASQAPAATLADGSAGSGDPKAAGEDTASGETDGAATGNSPYYTDLPPLVTPDKPGSSSNLPAAGSAEAGIPASVLAAYKHAERTVATTDPSCRLPWQLLAAIGKVESGQARGGRVDANGTASPRILGPALNGQGFALIKDTDGGAYDGDAVHDRAVGPMQFIPSTWASWGQDANGDGRKDPNNIYDAALAAGRYLCANDRDLALAADLDQAVLSYNRSTEYLRTVRSWYSYYQRGTHEIPDGTGTLPSIPSTPTPSPSPGTGSGPSATPSPKPSPDKPGGKPSPGPSKPGGGGSTSPTPKPPTPKPTPPSATFGSLENAGTGPLRATAGQEFDERVSVLARNAVGAPLAKVPVTFTVTGGTGTLFAGGKKTVTVRTGADGTATAPKLQAGEKAGEFTVTAVAGTGRPRTLTYAATVTARQADAIARTDEKALVAAPGEKFADAVTVKATYKDAAAAGVAVTATMVKDRLGVIDNDKGPYFKDADGKPVRTLTTLTTDTDGQLRLPEIFADDNEGTYLLRLTTEGGASVVIELTVKAPEETTPEEPAPDATETPAATKP
ncbi:lytic transglycosylase domain-containing protein [Streptomyces rubiginosohelvolus]|uniref:lytic transglycosylase domain-containing protein n=1 Tax=unclassified Streptomyces TaxID=2593676 RepID=UPI00190BC74C|nr:MULTISPECIES: lytic transglycosylase domain-containing protein [unclassified Streptomyces]MBK3529786.1 lytic transglycosylase domain-containing protein [Streptomyces sp. MBT72]MBK3539381.1 lytic transglycosylase domain-containing protein [Streptomyces sp. MBT67]MBK3549303.1 lytic transglycosylase domain-containing protein [Streptomyces sp. MBT61]MBK6032290.1 lytic transglycosylase domain-containing protein [Streptomyces sp. MBT59]